ncbi:50S ribosomal protein L11 [Candidatus Mycoplasma haematominutum]|uniref:Large ribosomal subunit protein uL11 n=1 Tax=Candidatus Mycoplasma haematominutum 'Birmingham 1' TaxID=1116213 RepID=G8C2P0_9MOLU|nr:50S ribosomal protein L11 [Candidatus Mycoplasma haematominutum]CCE66588.1 ribosomal protein L11 [Candidatus Mycoplasma haematominutum 'Birmingham 1']
MFFKTTNRIAKIELIGGQAKPGPTLASLGINMVQFSREFNEKTVNRQGERVPVIVEILPSKAFKFQIKTTPVSELLKKAASIEKGAANAKTDVVASLPYSKIVEIAQYKLKDSNTDKLESMISMISGTARQMGIKITQDS